MEIRGSSQRVIRLWIGALMAALLLLGSFASSMAQGNTDTLPLSGRLGGTLEEIQARFGTPDWTDTNLVGYNSVSLAGVDTIVVVYYDGQNIVNKISLVYLTKPAQLADTQAIADVVADIAPEDGTCSPLKVAQSGLGNEVYPCSSEALANVITPAMLAAAGLKGDAGSYSFSIDPTVDDYFEIIVQPGIDTDTPPPTAVPTTAPEPTAVPSLTDKYAPVPDVRDLAIGRGYDVGDYLSLSGTVFNIEVEAGNTYMQIYVPAPNGSTEAVVVAYSGDSAGVYEGTWVTAYGVYFGPFCFQNVIGGQVCQPLVRADVLEY